MTPAKKDDPVVTSIADEFLSAFGFYKESLPDIVTFAEKWCGKRLYPRQKTLLRLIFLETENMTDYDKDVINEWSENILIGEERIGVSPKIWDRINWLKERNYNHFREVEFIGGRRGGKGHIGGIIGAYQTMRLILMDSPQFEYGIDPNKDLYLFVTATNLTQARDYQYKDIAETITNAPAFQPYISSNRSLWLSLRTRADIRKMKVLEHQNVKIEREIASIKIVALSSNSRSGRGAAAYSLFFDEMAHMQSGSEGPQTAEAVYQALTPSLDQLGKDALIYIPSSPYTKVGAAYQIYLDGISLDEEGFPKNPNILVIQLPSWESYKDWDNPKVVRPGYFRGAPQVYDEEARRLEIRDPDTFKVERRAQWSETINAYLNPAVVDKMFSPLQFDSGIRKLENYQKGVMRWIYRGHADPSQSQANFAMAIGHTEPVLDEESGETFQHVFFDWLHVWKPEDFPDHQIDYIQIQEELVNVISQFPTLKDFSYDQYGGFVTVPLLKSALKKKGHGARVHQATFTVQTNQIRAERFKSALGMGWVHSPKDALGPDNQSLLELELKFLQLKNGKVVKQEIGMITTKDLADCVMEVTSELLSDQIDRYERTRGLNARLVFGAKGGYHTGGQASEGTRDRLNQVGKTRRARKTYGV